MDRETPVPAEPEWTPPEPPPETDPESALHRTPWWVISLLFHAAVIGLAMLVIVYVPKANGGVIVLAPQPPPSNDLVVDPPDDIPTVPSTPTNEQESPQIFSAVEPPEPGNPGADDPPEPAGEAEIDSTTPVDVAGNPSSIGILGGPPALLSGRPHGPLGRGVGGPPSRPPDEAERAVERGLSWLVRHQNDDGSWSTGAFTARCGRFDRRGDCSPTGLVNRAANYDVGLTGLALLAFLGTGYTQLSRDRIEEVRVGDVVRRGLLFLISQQGADGRIGPAIGEGETYNHAIAALALCEAYGLTRSNRFRDAAARAIDWIVAAQNPGRGWRYRARSGDNDTSNTGWAVMALKSAEACGIPFDPAAYDGARNWLESMLFREGAVTGEAGWQCGYTVPESVHVSIPGVNDQYAQHPAMTAIWIMSEIFMTHRGAARLESGARTILADPPRWEAAPAVDCGVDFYYWYYASLALFQLDGPDGASWRAWNASLVPALAETQNTEDRDCRFGSWEPVDRWSCRGGRVYATAINTLTLEVYYRYASVFGGR